MATPGNEGPEGDETMEWMTMPLKRYAEFSGRSRRKEYWMWTLLLVLVYFAFGVLLGVLGGGALLGMANGSSSGMAAAGGAALIIVGLFCIFALAILIPGIAVTIRRLHDTNRSGWFVLLPLAGYLLIVIGTAMGSSAASMLGIVAYFGLTIALIVFLCLDGTPGPNRYGPDPKARGEMEPVAY